MIPAAFPRFRAALIAVYLRVLLVAGQDLNTTSVPTDPAAPTGRTQAASQHLK